MIKPHPEPKCMALPELCPNLAHRRDTSNINFIDPFSPYPLSVTCSYTSLHLSVLSITLTLASLPLFQYPFSQYNSQLLRLSRAWPREIWKNDRSTILWQEPWKLSGRFHILRRMNFKATTCCSSSKWYCTRKHFQGYKWLQAKTKGLFRPQRCTVRQGHWRSRTSSTTIFVYSQRHDSFYKISNFSGVIHLYTSKRTSEFEQARFFEHTKTNIGSILWTIRRDNHWYS